MANIDAKNDVKALNAADIQLINTDTITAGTEIDMLGFESLNIYLSTGVVTAGDVQLLIQDSDVSGSGFADVADDFLIGTELDTNLTATGISRIGYVGKKRYVLVSLVTANSANLTAGAIAALGSPRHAPVA